jgi:membrane associated rhomboid family serine protease
MDQMTDIGPLLARGNELLFAGQPTEAAMEFTRAVQADGSAAAAHLGVAEANMALGAYGVVTVACRKVLELAPGSADAAIAQALLYVLDRRYDLALPELEHAERLEPGRPYVHALRGYCYRQLGNRFDAQAAEAKAARLASSRELKKLFPQVQQPAMASAALPQAAMPPQTAPGAPYEAPRAWSERSAIERRAVQWRFATRGVSASLVLIVVNIAVYVICALVGHSFFEPVRQYFGNNATGVLTGADNPIYSFGTVQGALIASNPLQAYRLVTSMFLHENILHIGTNMLSLYFLGPGTESMFGKRRFLLMYFAAGILGGILQVVISPYSPAVGASGAIFGIFGAFGAFILLQRRRLGPAGNALIGQWFFWLAINLYFGFSQPGIGIWDHIGGLAVGFVLGAVFVNMGQKGRRYL